MLRKQSHIWQVWQNGCYTHSHYQTRLLSTADQGWWAFFPPSVFPPASCLFLLCEQQSWALDLKLLLVSRLDRLKTTQNITIMRACQTPLGNLLPAAFCNAASDGSDFKCRQAIGISLTDELVKSQLLVSVFTVVCKSDSLKTANIFCLRLPCCQDRTQAHAYCEHIHGIRLSRVVGLFLNTLPQLWPTGQYRPPPRSRFFLYI